METLFSLLSGLLMFVGYATYIKKTLREEISPNPTTWLMFSYGTALLTLLEWDSDAGALVLLTPGICAACSLYVAYILHKKHRFLWPKKTLDRVSLCLDLVITIFYLSAWFGTKSGFLTQEQKDICVLVFLVASNATAITEFSPVLKDTMDDPNSEHPQAWTIWTLSYILLIFPTWKEVARGEGGWELLVYPILNSVLHGLVAIVSSRRIVIRA